MELMIAFGWLCIMLLIGVFLRAKIKLFRNILMPACVIGGILGFILLNIGVIFNVNFDMFNQMTTELFTLSFISLGLTGLSDDSEGGSVAKTVLKGGIGLSCIWTFLWAVTPLIGYVVIKFTEGIADMDAVYGLLIPTAFCDGPGQAMVFGNMFESYGWRNASQVGVLFAVIGFLYAFGVGVPMAKWGMKKGLAKHAKTIPSAVAKGIYQKDEQREPLGNATTYSGNIDTLALHIALLGLCYIGAVGCSKLVALIPGTMGVTLSSFMFIWGLIVAYIVRWIMKKLNLLQYTNEVLQTRITGACTDLLVCSAFMAIQITLIAEWIVPILIVTAVSAIVTFGVCVYFGSRMGSEHDFERTLAIFGCATGTTPTGVALVRIVDPNLETPASTELGAMNVVAMLLSTGVYLAIPALAQVIATGSGSFGFWIGVCIITAVVCLIVMKVCRVWGKPTWSFRK